MAGVWRVQGTGVGEVGCAGLCRKGYFELRMWGPYPKRSNGEPSKANLSLGIDWLDLPVLQPTRS